MPVRIFICGDIFIQSPKKHFIADDLQRVIKGAGIAVCNFEGPIKSGGNKIAKIGPHLEQAKEAVSILGRVGFNLFSLANNHIFDFGEEGLTRTIDEIKKNNAQYVGAGADFNAAYELKTFSINSLRIGFLAFSEMEFGTLDEDEKQGGCAWINHPYTEKIIKESRTKVDFLIVIAHAGIENVPLPLPEWRQRYKELCDCGADVIIGHHPHFPQGFEKYNGSLLIYSLGNFYFDYGKFMNKKNLSYSILLEVSQDKYNFEIIHHEKINGEIIIKKNQESNYFEKINGYLQEEYSELLNQQIMYLYENRYRKFNDIGLVNSLVSLAKRTILFRKYTSRKELMYLHNSMIESHRYATVRGIKLMQRKIKIDYSGIIKLINEYYTLDKK